MGNWDGDDCGSDRDDPAAFQRIRAWRPLVKEAEPHPAELLVSIEEAFVGSLYRITDCLWGFSAAGRVSHPGVCVRCDNKTQQAVLVKGTSFREELGWRYDRCDVLVVEPTPENGLKNPTVFALDPRPIDLRILRRIHLEEGPRGRLSEEVLWAMEARLAELERALAESEL